MRLEASYRALMERRGEILGRALGIDYGGLEGAGGGFDEVRQELRPIIARSVRRGCALTLLPGQVAGRLNVAEALDQGRVVIRMERPQEVDPAAEGVATGDFIDSDGDPPIHARIEPEIAGGAGTAAPVVNMAACGRGGRRAAAMDRMGPSVQRVGPRRARDR